ncbi:MAG TPA: DUF1501 domain-containing protein [Planctomycetaceae bacterium]|nr:DUF1501 domain-containing protein [Planctomycetaceae bacterium]
MTDKATARRDFLKRAGLGCGSLALTSLLHQEGVLAETIANGIPANTNPLAVRQSHHAPKAKSIIWLFQTGSPSQVDTFDYKPELIKRHGQPMPGAEEIVTFQGKQGMLTKSPWEFKPRGESGKMISELLPQMAEFADDMCFLHSLTGKTNTHGPGENFMSTGYTLDGFPSMGAWTTWALGTENQNLPAYVAISDPRGTPQSSVNNWGPGFLPAAFQGTEFNAVKPLQNLSIPSGTSAKTDLATRNFLKSVNERHLEQFPGDSELAARISSYELAARMQLSVPEVTDLSTETSTTLKEYGADDLSNPLKAKFAKNCILARRLIEKGVRFVQLFNGAYQTGGEGVSNWDGHKAIVDQYNKHGPVLDQPCAALLRDMKRRGLLKDTLVVWMTEFGRMPTFQAGASGRDHNPDGFTAWMMGAGVKAPFTYGATDEFSYKAVENVATVYDFHATILHLLGLNHERLTYYHNGFERRLTDVHGHVIRDVLA